MGETCTIESCTNKVKTNIKLMDTAHKLVTYQAIPISEGSQWPPTLIWNRRVFADLCIRPEKGHRVYGEVLGQCIWLDGAELKEPLTGG